MLYSNSTANGEYKDGKYNRGWRDGEVRANIKKITVKWVTLTRNINVIA